MSVSYPRVPYPSIHLQPTLLIIFLPVLRSSPVRIIPPSLHTFPSPYQPHYKIFLSMYFRFLLPLSFHHCSIPIHPLTTHTLKYIFSRTTFFPCQYHTTIVQYPSNHLPPTLLIIFLPVPKSSPVSINPPLLHTHPSTYYPRCIIFFYPTSGFPCYYNSILAPHPIIHLPPPVYIIFSQY